jgi:hypothetical protein
MPHYYEKNIVEIKEEYTAFLISIITPLLYEGIKTMYNYSIETHHKLSRTNPDNVPNVLKIFQVCLKEVPALNQQQVENETRRIKEASKCSEWFDDLVKAVVKSYIILLTFTSNNKQSDIVNRKYHERVRTSDFIHKAYIEIAREVYNHPELFYHKYPTLEIKRNQREIYNIIQEGIKKAIRKMLPIKLILDEYLTNEYTGEELMNNNVSESQYNCVKYNVQNDLHGTHSQSGGSNHEGSEHEESGHYDEENNEDNVGYDMNAVEDSPNTDFLEAQLNFDIEFDKRNSYEDNISDSDSESDSENITTESAQLKNKLSTVEHSLNTNRQSHEMSFIKQEIHEQPNLFGDMNNTQPYIVTDPHALKGIKKTQFKNVFNGQ